MGVIELLLDHYKLVSRIRSGGIGEVFLAQDVRMTFFENVQALGHKHRSDCQCRYGKWQHVLLCAMLILATAACSGTTQSPPDGYLGTSSTGVYFLVVNFPQNASSTPTPVSGQFHEVYEPVGLEPTTTTTTEQVTGTDTNNNLTLYIGNNQYMGSLHNGVVSLQVAASDGTITTSTFGAASTDDYNQKVKAFQDKINKADATYQANMAKAQATMSVQSTAQATQQSADQAITNDNNAIAQTSADLQSDSAALAGISEQSTLSGFANDWQSMQNDYATEVNQSKSGCANGSGTQTADDATQVHDDETQMHDDDTQFADDQHQYQLDLAPVDNDMKQLTADWNDLNNVIKNNPSADVKAQYTQSDIQQMMATGQQAENTAKTTMSNASNSISQYDQEAKNLDQQASNVVTSMNC